MFTVLATSVLAPFLAGLLAGSFAMVKMNPAEPPNTPMVTHTNGAVRLDSASLASKFRLAAKQGYPAAVNAKGARALKDGVRSPQ